MSATPMPTNQTATVVNEAIDGIFKIAVNLGEASAIAAIDAAVPALAAPIISTLTNDVIDEVFYLAANAIYQQFARFVAFEVIDIQTGIEASNEQAALAALKKAQLGGNSADIQTALQNFGKAVGALTVLDGSASPGNL